MAGLNKGVPQPTEIKLHQKSRILEIAFSDGHDTGIYSWDLLYDYGRRQDEMWRHYLKRMEEAGASREPAGKT
jgi:DUF971 family protein